MTYQELRNHVASEIDLQDSMQNQIGERWLPQPVDGLFTVDEHTRLHLPQLEIDKSDHSIVVASLDELAQVFDAASELAGGHYLGKDTIIKHESEHAKMAERLGQERQRFMAHLAVGASFTLPDGRKVRCIGITPSTLLEDVQTSRLGIGLFLGSPEDTASSVEDTKRIQSLGYRDVDEVIKRAADYNTRTRSNTYPLPRH